MASNKYIFHLDINMTIIVLNDSLEQKDASRYESAQSPKSVAKYRPFNREDVLSYVAGSTPTLNLRNHGLFGLLSHAYTYHAPVVMNPTDVWILIISQLKTIIKENAEEYRHLFTESDDKTEISVPSNSFHELPVNLVIDKLNEYLKFDTNLVRTKFSTDTDIANEVKDHLLLDMSSPFFSYTMFMCGIPSIKLGGTVDDWQLLENNFIELNKLFYSNTNEDYICWQSSVLHIVSQLLEASKGNYDVAFFEDIYTQQNIGSGNELQINGWITNLFYKMPPVSKIDNFNSHASCVEYVNTSTNKNYAMISGGFSYNQTDDGFIQLEYSKHFFEIVPREKTDRNYFKG